EEVASLDQVDLAALRAVPFDEEVYRREVGVTELYGEPGFTTLERLWARPTLEVNGVAGGGFFTVIPHSARAHVTCRLVPNQDPGRIATAIEEHVAEHAPPGVEVEVTRRPGAVPAYAITAGHPGVLAAQKALRRVYPGQDPLLVRIGGTLPAAAMFERVLGLKTLLFSFSTGDDQLHAPDEFFRLDRLRAGLRAWAELWRLLPQALRP